MKIDGRSFGTSSVTKGLARKRLEEARGKSQDADKDVVAASNAGIDAATSEHDHAGEDATHDVIKGVVAEHGPSKSAEVRPDGEYHSVHTVHEDGHKHASHGHPHIPHVAEHLAHAAGAQDADDDPNGEKTTQEPSETDNSQVAASSGENPLSFMSGASQTGE